MMLVIFLWCLSALVVDQSLGFPKRNLYSDALPSPSYMLGGGFYRNPSFERNYYPGSLSAVVTKDIIATNSFAGAPHQQYPTFQDASSEQYTEKVPVEEAGIPDTFQNKTPDLPIDDDTSVENSTPNQVYPTKRRGGRKPNKNEDDENSNLPWSFAKGGPSYTAFFPINISGGGRFGSRTRNANGDQDEVPYGSAGSATAIANAFSTGKGGVATSHATSFGDPNLAAMFLRSGMNNVKGYKEH